MTAGYVDGDVLIFLIGGSSATTLPYTLMERLQMAVVVYERMHMRCKHGAIAQILPP